MKIFILMLFCWFFVQSNFCQGRLNEKVNCFEDERLECFVVKNQILKNGERDNPTRTMLIYLDKKDFSEKNLRMLFTEMSSKYPNPLNMEIFLETNWSKINIALKEIGQSGESNDKDLCYWSIFFRQEDGEFFRYNPVLKSTDIKTVVLKGEAF